MPVCPECQEFFRHSDIPRDVAGCPHCGERTDSNVGWQNAARVGNLAEAGYLVSRLAGEGIEARLVGTDSFDAITGAWASAYLLQVAPESLAPARELLLAEAEEADREELNLDERGESRDEEPLHLVLWRPVALMAVAGLATLWLGQRFAEPRPRVAPHRGPAALGRAIEAIGEPFVVENGAGHVQHRLQYRSAQRAWLLESDTDGDGRLDTQQIFMSDGAGKN